MEHLHGVGFVAADDAHVGDSLHVGSEPEAGGAGDDEVSWRRKVFPEQRGNPDEELTILQAVRPDLDDPPFVVLIPDSEGGRAT